MSTVTFDTLKFVKTLEASGFAAPQSEAIAAAYRDASNDQELVTKKNLQVELAPLKVIMGGVIALIVKAFF